VTRVPPALIDGATADATNDTLKFDPALGHAVWGPGGGSGDPGSEQVTEWWQLSSSGATSRLLSATPVGALVVSLNGLVQRLGQEFTMAGRILTVLAGMSTAAGDVLEATYHPDGEPATESATGSVTVVDDSTHNAFPGLAVADDGTRVVSYRTGSGHATGVGVAKVKRSTDGGATWGAAITVYSGANDFRDPVVSNTPYGLLCNGFDYTGTVFPGLRVHRSTDNGLTWSQISAPVPFTNVNNNATSAPIVTLPDGTLIWPVYGTDTGDTVGRTKVLVSVDGGVTWTVRASLISGGSTEYVEPNLCVLSDGTLLMMIRSDSGTSGLYVTTSTDSGVTWSARTLKFAGQSGRPAVLELWGRVYLMYRSGGSGPLAVAHSDDQGATWTAVTTWDGSGMYTYGAWADTGGAVPSAAWAHESSTSNSDVFFRRVPV
jgi:hypothetical protein